MNLCLDTPEKLSPTKVVDVVIIPDKAIPLIILQVINCSIETLKKTIVPDIPYKNNENIKILFLPV